MRQQRSLLKVLAALVLAHALPCVGGFAVKSPESKPCDSLRCILLFPNLHTIASEDLSPPSLVDVILHFSNDQIAEGRSAAERITGISIDHFIAPSSFVAAVPASSLKAIADEPLIRSVTRLLPEHKFSLSDLRRFFSGDVRKLMPQTTAVNICTPPSCISRAYQTIFLSLPPRHRFARPSFS
jgi:hypothetical protein